MARKQDRAAQPQTHSRATTTPRVRRAIQLSEEKNIALAKRYGVSRKTIAKWKARESTSDARMGPTNPRASILTQDDEAIILAYRWRTRLPLDDCLDRLRRLMPKLSRSLLYRCLRRRGLGRIGSTASSPPLTSVGLKGPYRFEITAIEIVFRYDVLGAGFTVLLAVEEVTKHLYAEVAEPTPENAAAFLAHLVAEFPQRIIAVSTNIHPAFADWRATFDEDMAEVSPHPFAVVCRANKMVHTRTVSPLPKSYNPKWRDQSVEIRSSDCVGPVI